MVPQCPLDAGWADMEGTEESVRVLEATSNYRLADQPGRETRLVLAAIDAVVAAHAEIDPQRIYLAGWSLGGFGTYELLMRRPTFFAAAVVISGGGDETRAALIAGVPIWDFHGALDEIVNVQASRNMMAALRQAGGQPRYTEYARRRHSLGEPDAEAATLDWMFAQQRRRGSGGE